MKKNLYLFELSDIFANQVYLPYSSGVVWSYSKNKEIIRDNYDLKDWFYYREDINNILIVWLSSEGNTNPCKIETMAFFIHTHTWTFWFTMKAKKVFMRSLWKV